MKTEFLVRRQVYVVGTGLTDYRPDSGCCGGVDLSGNHRVKVSIELVLE